MDNLPIVTSDHSTGSLAVTIVQSAVERLGWIFRRLDQAEDFGTDAEIEIVDRSRATGTLIKCQIKGGSKLKWENEFERTRVKVSTYNNWKALQLPVIVFLVDVNTEDIYWISPSWQTPKKLAEHIYLKFHSENKLDRKFSELESYLKEWKDIFSFNNCFNEIELISAFFDNINNQVTDAVPDILLDKEMEGQLYLIYKHTLQLRSQTSLPIRDILTYEHWLIRNAGMWETDGMYYGTVHEMLRYLRPYYDEAIVKVKEILEKSERTLLNYNARVHLINDNVYECHELSDDEEFHKTFEAILLKGNAKIYSYANKKNN